MACATSRGRHQPLGQFVREGARPHRRVRPLRADDVHAHAAGGPLVGEALDEVDHAGLAGRIGHVVRPAAGEGARGEGGERSPTGHEMAVCGAGDVQGAGQVDVDDLREGGRRRVRQRPEAQDPGRHDHVVEAAQRRRRGRDPGIHRSRIAHVEAGRAALHDRAGTEPDRVVGDRPPDPVRPADDQDPGTVQPADGGHVGRREGPHLEHPVGHDEIDPGRDLEVHLVARDGQDAGPRHVPQDEAAVVRRAEVAGVRGRLVRLREDRHAEDLRCLAPPVAAALRDLDDLAVLDDDERVGAGDDRVRGVRRAVDHRRDGPPDHVERDQRPDRVVHDDDVVVGGVEGQQARARALVAGRPAGHHAGGDRHPGGGQLALGLRDPVRVRHDHEIVDAGGGDRPDAAQEDRLAGEADELLRHLRAEAVPGAAGQEDRMDSHRLHDRGASRSSTGADPAAVSRAGGRPSRNPGAARTSQVDIPQPSSRTRRSSRH